MTIEISCPQCGEEFRVRDEAAGKSFKCKVCGTTIRIPEDDDDEDDDDDLPPVRRRSRRDEDDEDGRPRKRRRRSSGGASKTLGPAIGLYVTGGLGLAYGLFNLVAVLVGDPAMRQPPPGMDEAARMGYVVGFHAFAFGLPLINVVVLFSAFCLHTCRAYPMALIGCILASIPCCSPCFVLGMPFGIWGLVVLMDDDVKRAFE